MDLTCNICMNGCVTTCGCCNEHHAMRGFCPCTDTVRRSEVIKALDAEIAKAEETFGRGAPEIVAALKAARSRIAELDRRS